jgi:putative ABC transport system permease protein
MKLALRELLRRPQRFATATAILTLIALLLMFLGGLLDGLINSSTEAVTAQRGDGIAFSAKSRLSFPSSRITADQRAAYEAKFGAENVGGIGVAQFGGRLPDAGPRDLVSIALFGYELAPTGVPDQPPVDGEVYADEVLRDEGVTEGMTLLLGPARVPVTVAGFVKDVNYLSQGTLWGSLATWREAQNANRPDDPIADGVVQSLIVRGDVAGFDQGDTTVLTIDEAVNALPGVKEQRGTFGQIIGVTIVIAIVVVGLFFALITVERIGLYGILKAIGARSRTLFVGVLLQAVVLTLIASIIAGVLATILDRAIPAGSIPFDLSVNRLVTSIILLLVAAIIGSAFSLRRVLKVDPAAAIGSVV